MEKLLLTHSYGTSYFYYAVDVPVIILLLFVSSFLLSPFLHPHSYFQFMVLIYVVPVKLGSFPIPDFSLEHRGVNLAFGTLFLVQPSSILFWAAAKPVLAVLMRIGFQPILVLVLADGSSTSARTIQ